MADKICPHCDPCIENPIHWQQKIDILISPALKIPAILEKLLKPFPQVQSLIDKIILRNLFRFFQILGILREVPVSSGDEGVYNRTLVLINEAKTRNLQIKNFKLFSKHTNFFSIDSGGKKIIFEGLPHLHFGHVSPVKFDDKYELKIILRANGLPCPEGESFRRAEPALYYAQKIGFPLVVKPRCGSLSKHTTCNIQSLEQLKEAIGVVQIISQEFMVEKFIKGDVYRITLVDNKVVACCAREAPNIIGDGTRTIKQLVELKNSNPLRGKINQKNFTLHQIPITEKTASLLLAQGLTFKSIPAAGQKVYLHQKVILSSGADIHDKTDRVNPENKLLFERVAQLCQAPMVGLDFICASIEEPYFRQECAIIEANSLPFIDMHHYPVTGTTRNVAGALLDYYLNSQVN